jgi:cellulose synthase/poly-beta-1,6-N-acetylglucosamine synthase-like glycosyltransferase
MDLFVTYRGDQPLFNSQLVKNRFFFGRFLSPPNITDSILLSVALSTLYFFYFTFFSLPSLRNQKATIMYASDELDSPAETQKKQPITSQK